MAHSSSLGASTNGTYYSLNIENLKETYLEYMPHLSLLAPVETKVVFSKGYEELKENLVERNGRIQKLEEKIGRLEEEKTQTEKAALEEVRALRKVLEEKGLL